MQQGRANDEYEKSIELGKNAKCVPYLDALMYCYSPANQVSYQALNSK